jgi:hypothetical protein
LLDYSPHLISFLLLYLFCLDQKQPPAAPLIFIIDCEPVFPLIIVPFHQFIRSASRKSTQIVLSAHFPLSAGNLAFTIICVFGALSVRTFLQDSGIGWVRDLSPALMFLSLVGVAHTALDLVDVYVLRPIQIAVSSEVRESRTIYLLWAVLGLTSVSFSMSNYFLGSPTTSYLESWTGGIDGVLLFTRSTLATPMRLLGWSAAISDWQETMQNHEQLRLAVAVVISIIGLVSLFLGVRLWKHITFIFGFSFIFVTFLSLSGLGFSVGSFLASATSAALATTVAIALSIYALKATYDAFGSYGWTVIDPHSGDIKLNFTPYLRGGVISTFSVSASIAFWISKFWVNPAPIALKYALQIFLSTVWGRALGSVLTKSARLIMIGVLAVGCAYMAAFVSRQTTSTLCANLEDFRPAQGFCSQELPFLQLFITQNDLINHYGSLAAWFPSLSGIVLTPPATFWSILLVLVLSGGAKTLRPIVTFVLGSYAFGWLAGVISPIGEESAFTLRLIFGATRYSAHDLIGGLVFVLFFSVVTVLPLMLEPFFRIALTSSIGLGVLMFEQEVIGKYLPFFNYVSWVGVFVFGVWSQLALLMLEFFGGSSDSDDGEAEAEVEVEDS